MAAVRAAMVGLSLEDVWTESDADRWWREHDLGRALPLELSPTEAARLG